MIGEIGETIAEEVEEIEEVVVIAEVEDSTEENVEVKLFRVSGLGFRNFEAVPK